MKVYLHTHNGNVQQNPPCVESCVTKEISISPQLSPTMFDPVANSVLLRAHLCTAVDFMCRKPCVRNCSRECKGLYNNGNVILTTHLCTAAPVHAQNPVFEIFHDESVKVHLHIHVQRECSAEPSMRRILLCSKVFSIFPRFSPTTFYRDATSVLLQILALLCTAVLLGSMRRTLCSKLFVRRA